MNRRKFLSRLSIGAAVAATAVCTDPWCGSIAGEGIIPHDELHEFHMVGSSPDMFKSYSDYVSFSQHVIESSIDKVVSEAAF